MATPMENPQQRYLRMQIETASQPQLLVMLFDAAVKKLHISKKAIAEKDIEKAHTELTKVQKIFTELMVALDVEKGGEIANNLLRIYDFIYHQLVQANIKQDSVLIDETLPVVESLRDGWKQAVDKAINEGYVEKASQPASFDSKVTLSSTADPSAQPATSHPTTPAPLPSQIPAGYNRSGASRPGQSHPPLSQPPQSPGGERPRLNIQG